MQLTARNVDYDRNMEGLRERARQPRVAAHDFWNFLGDAGAPALRSARRHTAPLKRHRHQPHHPEA